MISIDVGKANIKNLNAIKQWLGKTTTFTHRTTDPMANSTIIAFNRSWMNRSNPNSPFNLYGMTQAIRVKIVSIVLNNSGKNEGRDASATVRFQRFILNKANGISRYVDSNIATLTYKYNNNLKMDEKYRLVNPLGFQVTSYRVDPDATVPVNKELPTYGNTEAEAAVNANNTAANRGMSQWKNG